MYRYLDKIIQLDYKNTIVQSRNNAVTLDLVNKNLDKLRRLNANGIVAGAECIRKQIELLKKKQEHEQNQIKHFVSRYKMQILREDSENL